MMSSEIIRTGRQIAVRLQHSFPDQDWMGDLASRSGYDRETVEWHLQEEMEPPQPILEAARAMAGTSKAVEPGQASSADLGEGADDRDDAPLPHGDVSPDDLPFNGVPNVIGKLRKDG